MKAKFITLFLSLILIPVLIFAQSDDWSPPNFSERQSDRNRMVEDQLIPREINDQQVLDAMRETPRHLLVPEGNRSRAYMDSPLPIGHGQTISQPYIVAFMTQILNLDQGDKVLEIGTGSGYQAAVLSHITQNVYSIEIIEALGNRAEQDLEELGYTNVNVKIDDGYYGWEEHAPFDAIIVTAAAGHIPTPLVQQLKPGGTIVIPIGGPYQTQTLMKVTKSESGQVQTESLMAVRFVPMTGEAQN
ncbi:protein-L-isoaspartate(D-aspartate) O-methyltransferase [Rhodohalobacter sulfatireducens]|uniref:Protein-L-isoaspartate O-methyltransferase n=1 Tax=Rhodohalobacter sulfatireducens TaxID=2911366 RepID=A0ABS9KG28_9BACT|nr:protein-L-isoaspartate(D-aspartate) O-methyltransferase [Rhodohalobacter sulfatireducens]MCG2589819.1 protein-L-isoaspartate(D-aspartate) O-methyltransferase [Rhodohalobacter sulfatireducens]